jgi:predicted MFS family arabinose efflux permease
MPVRFLPSPPRASACDGRRLKAARLAVGALFFMNGALFANWVSRIPAVQIERGLSHGVLGLALLCLALGALVAMPLAGWCASRFGSDRVSRWAALGYCAALPVLAVAPNAVPFVLGLFCFGAMHGALDVAMNAQAVEVERRYARPIMSSFHALFSLGGLVGAALGGLVAAAGVTPRAQFSIVALFFASFTALLVYPRLLRSGEMAKVLPSAIPSAKAPFFRLPRALIVLGGIAFCVMMGEGAMADWSGIFLRRVAGAGEGLAAAGYAAFSVAMSIARFSGDRLSMRFGPVRLVRCSGILAAGGLALALFTREPLISLIGFAGVGAGFATVVPQVFSAAGRVGGGASGPALAAVTTIGYLGFLIGPPLIGLAAELFGLPNALGIIVVSSLLLVVLAGGVRGGEGPRTSLPSGSGRETGRAQDGDELSPRALQAFDAGFRGPARR